MRVTETVIAVYNAMADGEWRTVNDVALTIGGKRQHAGYVLRKLAEEGFMKGEAESPRRFALTDDPQMRALLAQQIGKAEEMLKAGAK